jgi:hypothetical protein
MHLEQTTIRITGQCHCGQLQITLHWPANIHPIPVRLCDCTFCIRHGCAWTSAPKARLHIEAKQPLRTYTFGTRTATFYRCSHCGCVGTALSQIGQTQYAVVNANLLTKRPEISLQKSAVHLGNESLAERLKRRQQHWIADVTISAQD